MNFIQNYSGLYTDFYELSMAQGYFLSGKQNDTARFDYFFRKNPFNGGFVIFAGLETLINTLQTYKFDKDNCNYLISLGFAKSFINYLNNFRFEGTIYSVKEGEVVFPNEPLLSVEGNIIETQLIESLLLNILNYESLIATKAARMRLAAKDKLLLEFGLRRAQGLGAIHGSRAAVIGGFDKTSNTFSAQQFNLQPSGTMAHSWIQTFDNELTAFRKFAEYYPDSAVLLVDTYDTLNKGVPSAIKIAKEMEANGNRLVGIRLDSGDLAYLSKKARQQLDNAGLNYVKIMVSNQLDEYVIRSLMQQQAPIDGFGIGTSAITGKDDGALDGVYKLAVTNTIPTMKVSENLSKMTFPGIKKIYRFSEKDYFYADGIELEGKNTPTTIYHPHQSEKYSDVINYSVEVLLKNVMQNGKITDRCASIETIAAYAHSRLKQLSAESKRFENPHIYKVGIGKELMNLRDKLKGNL